KALEKLLSDGLVETGIRRIGAEQELFLVDEAFQAAPVALEVLGRLKDHPEFTTELGLFNIEFNLDPQVFGGHCLSRMEADLHKFLDLARGAAAEVNSHVVLTGILPTLKLADLHLGNMTPN